MRLQQRLFFWILVSAILPLTVLILGLTLYGERLYRNQAGEEVAATLNNIVTDLERSLTYERSIMLQAARSAAMRQYLPVLDMERSAETHPSFKQRTDRLNRFLLSFSRIVHGQGTLRVLDLKGNTTIKVGLGRITPPSFEGVEGVPYAEQERTEEQAAKLADQLAALKDGEVGFLPIIPGTDRVLLDGVVPLSYQGRRVGYLVTSLQGQQLDFILQLAHRPYQGRLGLIEINPGATRNTGRVLYDDGDSLLFSQGSGGKRIAVETVISAMQDRPEGQVSLPGGQNVYYTETYPYPDRLISWGVLMIIDDEQIISPFRKLRYGILGLALFTLLVSLAVAHFGARQVARPLATMVENFRALARGETTRQIYESTVDEVSQLGQSFDEMQDSLHKAEEEKDRAQEMMLQNAKLASIGQLAAGIGHELNNPLNNILSYARLVERQLAGNDAIGKDIEAIREEAERATRIIKGILSFSRQVPAHFGVFTVRDWLKETVNLVLSTASDKNVTIELENGEDIALNADRGLLQQAMINLLINAIQASKEGQRITVGHASDGQHVILSVTDQGPGIAEQDMERLFEPFYTTKDVGEGSGLGLSITLGIVEQHHGALQLQNLVNEQGDIAGVRATIALPGVHQGESAA